MVGQPCRSASRRNDSVQLVLGDRLVYAGASDLLAACQRVQVSGFGQWPLRLGLQQNFLAKNRHYVVRILVVEFDNLLQRTYGRPCCAQVGVKILFKLVEQDFVLGASHAARVDFQPVNDLRTRIAHSFDIVVENTVDAFIHARAAVIPQHPDSGAAQGVFIECADNIRKFARQVVDRRVSGVPGHHSRIQNRRVPDAAGHRPGSVLAMGDGDNAAARHEAEAGFDTHDSGAAGGTDDGSVRFRAYRHGDEVGGNRNRGTAR